MVRRSAGGYRLTREHILVGADEVERKQRLVHELWRTRDCSPSDRSRWESATNDLKREVERFYEPLTAMR